MRWLIETIRALPVLALLAAPGLARADEYTGSAALDALFAQLKAAPNPNVASDIEKQIWADWFSPPVPDLQNEMTKASFATSLGDLKTALMILNGVVKDYPTYAEGWNQRATLEYMMNDLTDSLADIDKVLQYEPRHFGALSGRVMIYLKQGKHDAALKDMIAALAIHPYLSEKELFPELQQDVTHL